MAQKIPTEVTVLHRLDFNTEGRKLIDLKKIDELTLKHLLVKELIQTSTIIIYNGKLLKSRW